MDTTQLISAALNITGGLTPLGGTFPIFMAKT